MNPSLNRVRMGLLLLVMVCLLSTVGYMSYGWTAIDSLYMVVITMFGVGFGEVHPIVTVGQKIFTMMVIVCGMISVGYTFGGFIQMLTAGELNQILNEVRKTRRMEGLQNHAIICGYGRVGQILAQELKTAKFPFVVVELEGDRRRQVETDGFLCVPGSATDEPTLLAAGIERAKVIASVLPQDAMNIYIALTARNLNRNIRIIARGEQPSTEKKLIQAGADEVILPATIGALRMARSITHPVAMKFVGDASGLAAQEFRRIGVEVDELRLRHHAELAGLSVRDIRIRAGGNLLVVAVETAAGQILRDNFDTYTLHADDSIVVVRRSGELPTFLRGEVESQQLL